MKTINVKKIAQKRVESEKHDIYIYELLLKILAPYEGKKLTLREHKKIIAELDAAGFTDVTIRPEYSWTSLKFKDDEHPCDYRIKNGVGFTLFYNDQNAREGFTMEGFKKCNTWASVGAYERLEKTQATIEDGRAEKLQKAYNHLVKAIEALEASDLGSYYVPYTYDLERAFGYKLEEIRD